MESADHAVALQPDFWMAYLARAMCNSHLGNTEQALADFDVYLEALPDSPGTPAAWYNRGLCNQGAGHLEKQRLRIIPMLLS